MSTLLELRTRLNYELVVTDDAADGVYPKASRNQAIADGYAELWRVGVYKPLTQDLTSVDKQWTYALTGIRRLRRIDVLDSTSQVIDQAKAIVEDDGSGGFQLRLARPFTDGFTLRAYGWGKYVDTFADDAATDDLPEEYQRVPLLKAKAILFREQMAKFMRYGTRQQAPPEMNVTLDQLLGIVAATEREFAEGVKGIKGDRAVVGRPGHI